jgi:hypothetical protein
MATPTKRRQVKGGNVQDAAPEKGTATHYVAMHNRIATAAHGIGKLSKMAIDQRRAGIGCYEGMLLAE